MESKKQKKKNRTNQTIQIKFNKSIYSKRAIELAILAYKNLANFLVKEERNYTKVGISNFKKSKPDLIKNEFCNYVLHSIR